MTSFSSTGWPLPLVWQTATSAFLLTASAALAQNAGIIGFESASHSVNEQAGFHAVLVKRTGGSEGIATVNFATSDGTAVASTATVTGDYTPSSGTLVFGDGETEKVITVQVAAPSSDPNPEPGETFSLTLTGPEVGANDTAAFTINDTPAFFAPADQTTTVGTATGPIAFTISDAETPVEDLVVTAFSTNPAVLPHSGIVLGGSGASRTVTLTPSAGQAGAAQVTLLVTDAGGATRARSFYLRAGNASAGTALAITGTTPANSVPDIVMAADDSFTLNYTTANSAWVTSVAFSELDDLNLINSHGTGSTSDLRTQPGTSGATARTLRIRGNDNSTEAGAYGRANVTLGFTGTGAPANTHAFNLRVNPRAVVDNQLLAIPGTTSTFDVLANDCAPLAGHTFTITSVSTPANGTLEITGDGKYVRYTPTSSAAVHDTFTYTVTVSSSDAFNGYTFTGTGSVKIGGYVVADSATASQHTDIDLDYVDGVWTQNLRTDAVVDGAVQSGTFAQTVVDADEGIFFLDPSTKMARPAGDAYDVLGVPAGADVWRGPETSGGNRPFIGIASEETSETTVEAYTPVNDPRATSNSHWVRTDLVGFSGPGNFAAFYGGDVTFDTLDGLNSANDSAAGGNSTDTFWGFAGSHSHLAWFFTAPGRYTLTFRSTVKVNGQFVTSPDTTFTFDVDSMAGDPRLIENPPLARPDSITVAADSGGTSIPVLANDTSMADPYEVLAVTSVTQGAEGGTVAMGPDGASVTYAPAPEFAGSETFTYTVTDEHGGQATQTVTVTVNNPPTVSEIAAGFVVENGSTAAIPFTVGDTVTGAGNLVVTAISSNQTIVPNSNIVIGGSGADRALTITPTANQSGPVTITVTVTDANGGQTVTSFSLNVVANHVVPFGMAEYSGGQVNAQAWGQVTGDFNGDGKVDLVLAGSGFNSLTWLQGNGDGTFQPEQLLNAGTDVTSQGIAGIDYEGDGDLDLLGYEMNQVTNDGLANEGTITLYRNNGSAQFTRQVVKSGLLEGYQLAAGDLNGDGRADVVYGSQHYDSATLTTTAVKAFALQQPDGQFGVSTILTTTPYGSLQVGDVNDDGNLDVVTSGYVTISTSPLVREHEVKVFLGNGDGTMGTPRTITPANFPEIQDIVDLNGDGRKDLLAYDRPSTGGHLGYYPQQPDGSFGARVNLLPNYLYALFTEIADINRDSIPDIVSYSYINNAYRLSWVPGTGNGTYAAPVLVTDNPGGSGLHVVDADNDSHLDFVTVGAVSTTRPAPVAVLLNKTGENPMKLTAPAARTRVAGDPIDFLIHFGFPITVTGSPRVALDVGGNTVYANYVSGSGTSSLTFRYLVTSADLDLDGVQLASNQIELNGGTLTDPVGGPGVLEFPDTTFTGVLVNGRGPLVQMISRLDTTPAGTGTVRFAVQFPEDVTGVDTSDFTIRMNAGDLTGAAVTGVTGSGSLYEVTVSTGTGSGTLGLSVLDSASIFDSGSDLLAKGYAGGQVYTVRPEPVGDIGHYYVEGHADYRPVHDNGEFTYVWHGDTSVRPSDEVITYLDSTAIVNRSADARYDFLGVAAGAPLYISNSAGSIPSVPFLGWSGESLVANAFAEYRPSDPRITSATLREYVKVQMVGIRSNSGGDFSLYSVSSGTPTVWMASSDGINDTDNIWLYRTHFHRNTAFSKPGTYEIDVVVSGYLDNNANNQLDPFVDTYVESGIKTMVFHVDTLGARADSFTVNAGGTLNGNVTANDPWHEGIGAFAASVMTTTAHGTLDLQPDGTFTYLPLAGFTGADSFTYRLTNPRGGVTTATVELSVVHSLASWRQLYFGTTGNTGSAADDFDADFDGLENLLEFAFGLHPREGSNGTLRTSGGVLEETGPPMISINGEEKRVLFVRRKNAAALGLTYTVEFSGSLGGWEPSADDPEVIAENAELELVAVPFPAEFANQSSAFFRVNVQSAPEP